MGGSFLPVLLLIYCTLALKQTYLWSHYYFVSRNWEQLYALSMPFVMANIRVGFLNYGVFFDKIIWEVGEGIFFNLIFIFAEYFASN